jgi:hypothetical protein
MLVGAEAVSLRQLQQTQLFVAVQAAHENPSTFYRPE